MPVFDFNSAPVPDAHPECTYTTFYSNDSETAPEKPILVLDNHERSWRHHSCGIFTNPAKRTAFEFKEGVTLLLPARMRYPLRNAVTHSAPFPL